MKHKHMELHSVSSWIKHECSSAYGFTQPYSSRRYFIGGDAADKQWARPKSAAAARGRKENSPARKHKRLVGPNLQPPNMSNKPNEPIAEHANMQSLS